MHANWESTEAYFTLTIGENGVYASVKAAVLKAYELVPEAYRLKFRTWERSSKLTHLELAKELTTHFNR